MSMTYQQARDELSKLFNDAWSPRRVLWDDLGGVPPANVSPWARFTIKHSEGVQSTLPDHLGQKRWTRIGTIHVQLFANRGAGLKVLDPLCKIVGDAYEGQTTPGGAWFRNCRINEIGGSGEWFQVNVLIDFEYDEVK
jgi:hypothetical protein